MRAALAVRRSPFAVRRSPKTCLSFERVVKPLFGALFLYAMPAFAEFTATDRFYVAQDPTTVRLGRRAGV